MTFQFEPAEAARYRRQMALSGFGTAGQLALRGAHVAVLGAGGLGSPALLYLAGSGVGTITVIDDDVVEVSNLHRQVLHPTAAVGSPKAESAATQLHALNPLVQVNVVRERLTEDNALEILAGAQVLLDGTDNFPTRHVASWAAARLGIPHIWASILGFEAQLSVFWAGHGPVYEDLYPTMPPEGTVPSCAQAGVLGPVVGVVGASMAMEALKILSGVGKPLIGTLGYYDSLSGQWEYVPLNHDPASAQRLREDGPVRELPVVPVPGPLSDVGIASAKEGAATAAPDRVAEITVAELPSDAVLVDIREADEIAQFAIPGSQQVAWSALQRGDGAAWQQLMQIIDEANAPVVLYCASGMRSAAAWQRLHREYPTLAAKNQPILSLAGGIGAWLDAQV